MSPQRYRVYQRQFWTKLRQTTSTTCIHHFVYMYTLWVYSKKNIVIFTHIFVNLPQLCQIENSMNTMIYFICYYYLTMQYCKVFIKTLKLFFLIIAFKLSIYELGIFNLWKRHLKQLKKKNVLKQQNGFVTII